MGEQVTMHGVLHIASSCWLIKHHAILDLLSGEVFHFVPEELK